MHNFRKACCRLAANALGGTVGCNEVGVLLFESLQLLEQSVVFGVRDLRIVLDVIKIFVSPDLFPELFNCLFDRCRFRQPTSLL